MAAGDIHVNPFEFLADEETPDWSWSSRDITVPAGQTLIGASAVAHYEIWDDGPTGVLDPTSPGMNRATWDVKDTQTVRVHYEIVPPGALRLYIVGHTIGREN